MRPEEVMLVVYRPGPEFLVALRTPERDGYWNLVAGGVEEGEEPSAAALRELAEESGLVDPKGFERLPVELGYVRPDGTAVTLHAFRVEAPAGWEPTLNHEHDEYRWCSAENAGALLEYPEPREAVRHVSRALDEAAG